MKKILGWREWVILPELELPPIKAKVDTGARSSCLHAFNIATFDRDGNPWARFGIHPHQHDLQTEIYCEAPISDARPVTDSGGHTETRIVITSRLKLGNWNDLVEITLTNRDSMRFRMLLGRTTLIKGGFSVDPAESYLLGKYKPRKKK